MAWPSAGGLRSIQPVLSLRDPWGSIDHEIRSFIDGSEAIPWRGHMSLALGAYGAELLPAWVFLVADYGELGARYGPRAPRLAWVEAGAVLQAIYEWALEEEVGVLAYGGFDDRLVSAGLQLGPNQYPVMAVGLGMPFDEDTRGPALDLGVAKAELTRIAVLLSGETVVRARVNPAGPAGFSADCDPSVAVEAAVSELVERSLTWHDLASAEGGDGSTDEVTVELIAHRGAPAPVLRPTHWFTDRPLHADVVVASAAHRSRELALESACVELVERLVLPLLGREHVLPARVVGDLRPRGAGGAGHGVQLLGAVAWGLHVVAVRDSEGGYLAAAARPSLTDAIKAAQTEFAMLSLGSHGVEAGPRVGARLHAAANEVRPVVLETTDRSTELAESLPARLASALELTAFVRPSTIGLDRILCRLAARDAR